MKNILTLIFALFMLFSCNNKEEYERKIAEELAIKTAKNDSINAARTKYNDSILADRRQNKFKDFSGQHSFTMATDGISTLKGTVKFQEIDTDQYQVSGSAKSGKNSITINGTAKFLGNEYISFRGEILQDIKENGSIYARNGKAVFIAQGNNKFWRMQKKINNQGFVDYIDIHF